MISRQTRMLGYLFFTGLLLFVTQDVYADAIASSSITFSLQITSAAGTTVVYSGPWTAEAFAQTQNSLGELDNQFDSSVGGMAMANASATFAIGHADADAVSLTGNASGSLNISGSIDTQASSIGRATFSNVFMITVTGGSDPVPVDVTFSTDITGLLHVSTDASGQEAFADINLNLKVNSDTVSFYDSALSVGPNSSMTRLVATTLSGMLTLMSDTPYFVLAEADVEPEGTHVVPEPSTVVLFLSGLCYVGWLAAKRRTGGGKS